MRTPASAPPRRNWRAKAGRVKTDFFTRRDIYRALKEYADAKPALDEEQQRMLNKWLVKFERNGMGLSDKELKKFVKLNAERLDKLRAIT